MDPMIPQSRPAGGQRQGDRSAPSSTLALAHARSFEAHQRPSSMTRFCPGWMRTAC